jgi:hypothetical protein
LSRNPVTIIDLKNLKYFNKILGASSPLKQLDKGKLFLFPIVYNNETPEVKKGLLAWK